MIRLTIILCSAGALTLLVFGIVHKSGKQSEQEWFESLIGRQALDSARLADSMIVAEEAAALATAEAAATDETVNPTHALADFNGDHKTDSAFSWKNAAGGDSSLFVRFTGCVPSLYIDKRYRGIVAIQSPGDIDEDGKAEIFVVPQPGSNCEAEAGLYTFKENRWSLVESVPAYACDSKHNYASKINLNQYSIHFYASDSWSREKTGEMTPVTVVAR
ncbi:MAG: hypothetical protein FD123_923 [Bacteroidetes bacterium]|nr:MAG: hypothetical protein FD123_923 [Bacteroidota bacterium]